MYQDCRRLAPPVEFADRETRRTMGTPQLIVTAVLVEAKQERGGTPGRGVAPGGGDAGRGISRRDAGLQPRSRRPLTSPYRGGRSRRRDCGYPQWSRPGRARGGCGEDRFHFEQRHGRGPAVSTMWRNLSERGFVTRSRTTAEEQLPALRRPTTLRARSATAPGSPTSPGCSTCPRGRRECG
jgi:hypothetical protein